MREFVILAVLLAATLGLVLLVNISSERVPDKAAAEETDGDWIAPYIESAQIEDGIATFSSRLAKRPSDDSLSFGLGIMHFLRGLERMNQAWYRYGLHDNALGGLIPLFRFTTVQNPQPERITYDDARAVLQGLLDDLSASIDALSRVRGEVKRPFRIGMVKLDFNANGSIEDGETLWQLYARVNGGAGASMQTAQEFVIQLDTADARWLEAYGHLLSALAELFLAHDWEDLFERTAHLVFARPDTPYSFLRLDTDTMFYYVDLIAFVHLLNLPVQEPDRMRAAWNHLQQMSALSRRTWQLIEVEDDDDQEWIPSPTQTGVIPGIQVTEEMVSGWRDFLDELDDILAGHTLLPFWRETSTPNLGINLKRALTESKRFDLVMWAQGTDAEPFLEQGEVTDPAFWQRLMRVFRGQFIGFALWWN